MKANSLSFRLIAGAVLWVGAALVIAGFMLASLFRDHVERGFERQILLHLDRLAAFSQVGPSGSVEVKKLLTDPRFEQPYSGWYWQVAGPAGPVLRSRSLWDQVLEVDDSVALSAVPQRYTFQGPMGQLVWGVRRNVTLPGSGQVFQISVAADVTELKAAMKRFNSTLAWSLLVLGTGIVVAVIIQVRYGLAPLRRLQAELAAVRAGTEARLTGRFPDEVMPLVGELNALLDHSAAVVDRARSHVGNLAHGLKTPLTVIANAAGAEKGPLADVVRRQAATMNDLVGHHLARARTVAAGGVLGARTEVMPVLDELRRTLIRVHVDRGLDMIIRGSVDLVFRGERQDLQEMLGNLLDNACKWAASTVRVTLAGNGGTLTVVVEDDGPGLPAEARARVFDRGQRADEATPGDGLGLAIVRDVVELYGGSVALEDSTLGGLAARLVLPAG